MKKIFIFIAIFLISISKLLAQSQPDFDWVKINGQTVNWNSTTTIEMTLNETFSLKTRVSNTGDDSPAYYNNITYSFPQFTSSTHKNRVSKGSGTDSDLDYGEYWGNEAQGGDGYANYVMVEASDNNEWDGSDGLGDEENEFEVNIKPLNTGYFTIYIRAWANNIESWDGGTYKPSSSSYYDCLNLPAYKLNVYIPPFVEACYWSTTSSSGNAIPNNTIKEAGTKIYVNIHSTGFSSVNVKVYEDETITDLKVDEFTVTGLSDGFGSYPWTCPWMDDGYLQGIPEYYFKIENNNDWKSDLVQVDDTTPPSVPVLTQPEDEQIFPYNQTNISFDWGNSIDNGGYGTGVDHYHIQVSNSTSFTNIVWEVDRDQYHSNASHTFSPNRTYYWRVNATDKDNHTSPYSSSNRWFKIENELGWIAGIVYESGNTSNRIKDAILSIAGSDYATSDNNGEYSIKLDPGTYDLKCSAEDYEEMTIKGIVVVGDETTTANFNLTSVGIDNDIVIPYKTALHNNYPNPFNPTTTISYSLKENSLVSLEIYNLRGQKVKTLVNAKKEKGEWTVFWNGKDENSNSVCSGIYFYRLKTENFVQSKRMILLK